MTGFRHDEMTSYEKSGHSGPGGGEKLVTRFPNKFNVAILKSDLVCFTLVELALINKAMDIDLKFEGEQKPY